MKPNLLFFGSSEKSQIVKSALEKAGYRLVDNLKSAQLIVVADYGQKISQETLEKIKFGGLNLHPSLLPAYRGATPAPYQILNGAKESGISIIKMVEEFDQGPIVAQKPVKILLQDTVKSLLRRCFTEGAKLLISTLPDYIEGKITSRPQPKDSPTPYCHKFTKKDGFVSWEEFKHGVDDKKIRAFYPWPGVWTTMPNGKILKLLPKNMVQLEGKNPISLKQFKNGYSHLLK